MQATQIPDWAVGFVYLFEASTGDHKIGFSRDPARRLRGFATLPFSLRLVHSFPVSDEQIERDVHRRLIAYRSRSEWFRLPAELITTFCSIQSAKSATDLPGPFAPPAPRVPAGPAIRDVVAARVADLGLSAAAVARATAGVVSDDMMRLYLVGRADMTSGRLDAVFRVLGLQITIQNNPEDIR